MLYDLSNFSIIKIKNYYFGYEIKICHFSFTHMYIIIYLVNDKNNNLFAVCSLKIKNI